jgi:hypothetical protein
VKIYDKKVKKNERISWKLVEKQRNRLKNKLNQPKNRVTAQNKLKPVEIGRKQA